VVSTVEHEARSADETALLAGLQQAEPWALCALHGKLSHVVQRTLGRFVSSTADRDDLAQATLERVISTVVDGRFSRARDLSSWAASVAASVVQEHRRSSSREVRLRSDYGRAAAIVGPAAALDVERSLFARWELGRLRQTLARMRQRDVRALMLHHGLGYTLTETAAALGASEVATQTRLTRARRELVRRTGSRLPER
jgi:RNA polymerase sigma factor (sigma-70 family)